MKINDVVCLIILLFLFTQVCSGCGSRQSDGPRRYSVQGEITFKGKPVPAGQIHFQPDRKKGNSGPTTIVNIAEGKFATGKGRGVVGGAYIVQVTGYDSNIHGPEYSLDKEPLFPLYEYADNFPMENSTIQIEVPVAQKQQ